MHGKPTVGRLQVLLGRFPTPVLYVFMAKHDRRRPRLSKRQHLQCRFVEPSGGGGGGGGGGSGGGGGGGRFQPFVVGVGLAVCHWFAGSFLHG